MDDTLPQIYYNYTTRQTKLIAMERCICICTHMRHRNKASFLYLIVCLWMDQGPTQIRIATCVSHLLGIIPYLTVQCLWT